MNNTITDDIKNVFRKGNMLTKIIIVNIIVFVLLVLAKLVFRDSFQDILSGLSLSSELMGMLQHPWSVITYMFVHIDLFHLIFNMLVYYWFGNIVGDLIGDKKILPLYIMGGLAGFIAYSLYALVVPIYGIAYGASAAVMTIVSAAAFLAPNFMVRLILIGSVPIKYIAIAYVIIDLAKISASTNVGGHISHIGGLIFGGLFVYFLKRGLDLSVGINQFFDRVVSFFNKRKKSNLNITHRKKNSQKKPKHRNKTIQQDVDTILEKVKKSGYESLNKEEKESLFLASRDANK